MLGPCCQTIILLNTLQCCLQKTSCVSRLRRCFLYFAASLIRCDITVFFCCCSIACMAACRDSATLGESSVKPAVLQSTPAPAVADIVPAEAGQLPDVPFKTSGPPAAPALEATAAPASSPTTLFDSPISVPINAPMAMSSFHGTPALVPPCCPPQSQPSCLGDLTRALKKSLGVGPIHPVDLPADPVALMQHVVVNAAPAAAIYDSGLPPQPAAHDPSLANPRGVTDMASEAGSTASLTPTAGSTSDAHPSALLGSISTLTPAVGTSCKPTSPTACSPDATKQAIKSGQAASADSLTFHPTPTSSPESSPSQAPAPIEIAAYWPTLDDSPGPALLQNPASTVITHPATAKAQQQTSSAMSVTGGIAPGHSKTAKLVSAAASVATQLRSHAKPAKPVKISLAEFQHKDKLDAVRHQTQSDGIPAYRHILQRPKQEPVGQRHKGQACSTPPALDKQAAPASNGLQPDRWATSLYLCIAA